MKRYYISSIRGDGSEEDNFRPTVADYIGNWAGSIPCNPKTGMPTQAWVLVAVFDEDQAILLGVAGVDLLPDYPLDGLISAMDTADSLMVYQGLAAHGINTAIVNLCPLYSDLLARLQQANTTAPGEAVELTL